MKYSIITPSYNQVKFLERTILSVLNQNYDNLEYIIIDGGSTDGSVDILKKYENKITYWVSEKDNGQSNAVNKGLKVATGDIIGWINSDDIYYGNAIIDSAVIFKANPDLDVIFSNYNFIDENDNVIKTRKEIPFDYNTYLWSKGCYHANCAGFFRKRCFDKMGMLREDFHFGMDYELYLRFGKGGCKFIHVNKVWGGYRFHAESKTIFSTSKAKKDNNLIYHLFTDEITYNILFKEILTYYYKTKRLFKKLLNRSYF